MGRLHNRCAGALGSQNRSETLMRAERRLQACFSPIAWLPACWAEPASERQDLVAPDQFNCTPHR